MFEIQRMPTGWFSPLLLLPSPARRAKAETATDSARRCRVHRTCWRNARGYTKVEPRRGLGLVAWALLRGAGSAFVVGTGDLLRVARDKLCRVRIGAVHQHLHRRPIATRHVSA